MSSDKKLPWLCPLIFFVKLKATLVVCSQCFAIQKLFIKQNNYLLLVLNIFSNLWKWTRISFCLILKRSNKPSCRCPVIFNTKPHIWLPLVVQPVVYDCLIIAIVKTCASTGTHFLHSGHNFTNKPINKFTQINSRDLLNLNLSLCYNQFFNFRQPDQPFHFQQV